ncbi:uncharacterized protein LOC123552749 [Mercenaria mercenaria]|uniref:uncharacterized protein LOC123552749 n=1 Tax=Mercenaria mercenaria TaxID=6596 RepID=UPI00234F7B3F|nr:uncharacterized protein LOC123552749 [Mercenaria mercenaria]
MLLFACACLPVSVAQSLLYNPVPVKKYLFERVCWGDYGTVLRKYYKIRDKRFCGTKCAENSECTSFLYSKNAGWCRINSDVFVNRTNVGCNRFEDYAEITTVQPLRHAKPPTHCGPVPYFSSIIVNMSSNYSIGSRFPYRCDPCTSFPPQSSPGYLECGTDGKWIIPPELCVYGPDIGLLRNGSAIPVDAIGCMSTHNDTCPQTSVSSGLRFNGVIGKCYCDDCCCQAQDCCYDTNCYQEDKSYEYEYYYYDEYYY